jgi:SAM-dependent methyltransferase
MSRKTSGGYINPRLAEIYDLVPMYVSREDLQFFVDRAVASGGPVLELGCGTGRVLLPTARAGVRITGLDLAEPMLARLRGKLDDETDEVRERIDLVQADMCDFDLGRRFALAMIPFRPFQHLITVEEQLGCLRCANRHLEAHGKLIIDMFHLNYLKVFGPGWDERHQDLDNHELPDGRKISRWYRTVARHESEQYLDVEMVYELTNGDGTAEQVVQAFPFRWFFRYEVEHLLARCGFAVAEIVGDFDGSPFGDESQQMIFIAEKLTDLNAL